MLSTTPVIGTTAATSDAAVQKPAAAPADSRSRKTRAESSAKAAVRTAPAKTVTKARAKASLPGKAVGAGKSKAVALKSAATKATAPTPDRAKAGTKSKSDSGKTGKKAVKPRPVLVRDSFTMPEADFALIAQLKTTALGGRRAAKKSELLRAGLQLLAALDTRALVAALDRLETVKTGRPKKSN